MKIRMLILAPVIAFAAVAATEPAVAQGMMGTKMQPGMMSGGMMPGGKGQQPGNPEKMRGRMRESMMCPMMRSGMMQGGMMGSGTMGGGMTALFGSRVRPVMNLSVDDVRGYLTSELERLGNKRLKLGDIKSADGTITAEIDTVDNSLVQRLTVDRHTGAITYEN